MDDAKSRFLSFETTFIDEPSLSATKKQINETPEIRTRCLQILREDLKNLKDIEPYLEDYFLLSFLRVSKFDTQKTLQRLQRYFRQVDVLLDAFKNCSIPLDKARSFNHILASPYRLKNNSFLLIGLNRTLDYRTCTFAERFYLDVMTFHKLMENPVNQIAGLTLIIDFEGFNIHSLRAFTPGWIKLFLDTLMKVSPCRINAVHIVNAPSFFNYIFNLGYRFLSKKTQKRVFIHSRNDDWRSLHALIPKDVLPEEYGGTVKDEALINCLEDIEEMEKRFLKAFAFGSVKNQDARKSMKIIC